MKALKITLKILLALLILVIVFYASVTYYLSNHKEDILNRLEKAYNDNYYGTISFDDVSINTLDNFPSVSIKVKNIILIDSLYTEHKYTTLKAEKINCVVSVKELLQKEIQFKKFIIENGEFSSLLLSNGYSNLNVFQLKNKTTSTENPFKEQFLLSKNNVKISVKDFKTAILNFKKNKRSNAYINKLNTQISFNDSIISGTAKMDILMNEMGLNLANGTFFNNANVNGTFNYTLNSPKNTVTIPFFDLKIDEQLFKVKADINTKDSGTFSFVLENNKTKYTPTIKLISQNIQKKLRSFDLKKPFYTYTTLQGSFAYGSNPLVKIKFNTQNNTLKIKDSIQINNFSFKGDFVNRIYTDERAFSENKKNLKITFDSINGTYNQIDFTLNNTNLSTFENQTTANFALNAKGNPEKFNELFKNEAFFFKNGTFNLNTQYNGPITSLNDVLLATNTNLKLSNSNVFYKPTNVTLAIDNLELELSNKNANLKILKIPIENDEHINFSGKLNNFTSLLFSNQKDIVSSELNIYSEKMIWNDFMKIFETLKKSNNYTKKEKPGNKSVKALKETLSGIYIKFNPSLFLAIDSCLYNNFSAKVLKTKINFDGEDKIRLINTGFTYDKGKVNLNGYIDLSKLDETFFNLTFTTEKLDLGKLMRDFNYLNLSELQKTEKLEGQITINSNLKGIINDATGLDNKSLKGEFNFTLENAQIKGFEPLQKIGNIIFKKERFEDIRFAPISNTVYIKNNTIEIPQMEIRSTAFDLFVEGYLDYGNNTSIWVSIPLANLKNRDLINIPDKQGYINAGKKVFVEVKSTEENDLKYTLHLTNKKLYKEKDILNEYKSDHKNERKLRKANKKELRKQKREIRKNS